MIGHMMLYAVYAVYAGNVYTICITRTTHTKRFLRS